MALPAGAADGDTVEGGRGARARPDAPMVTGAPRTRLPNPYGLSQGRGRGGGNRLGRLRHVPRGGLPRPRRTTAHVRGASWRQADSAVRFHPWRTVLFAVWLSGVCSPAAICGEQESQPAKPSLRDGFVSLFDGKTLDGWHAVPNESASDWTVRDGAIVGRGSADRLSYLVWKDEHLTDFELELRYRLPGKGNTGVEIRGQPDPTGKRPFEGSVCATPVFMHSRFNRRSAR
jgi:hypothetical protein